MKKKILELVENYFERIDESKKGILEAVGDIELDYWKKEEEKWQKKLNEIIIKD